MTSLKLPRGSLNGFGSNYHLIDDLVQGIFDDPGGAGAFENGDDLANYLLVHDHLDRYPILIGLCRDGRGMKGGEFFQDGVEALFRDVHLQADLRLGIDRPLKEHGEVFDLFLLPRVFPGLLVGNEKGDRFEDRVDDPQVVGAERTAGLRQLDDRIRQERRLYLRGPPRKFYVRLHTLLLQISLRITDQLGRDPLSLQILHRLDRRIVRHGDHPTDRREPRPGIAEFGHHLDIRILLGHPVATGKAGVEDAVFDIPRHLLGAEQQTRQLRAVNGGDIAPATDSDAIPRLLKKTKCRLLKTALGDTQF